MSLASTQLRQDESTANVPIVVMTALASPDIEGRAQSVGANNLLVKPFSEEAFLGVIEHFVQS